MMSINLLFLSLPPFFCFHSQQTILHTKQAINFLSRIFFLLGLLVFLGPLLMTLPLENIFPLNYYGHNFFSLCVVSNCIWNMLSDDLT
jgi:hypothetical protein